MSEHATMTLVERLRDVDEPNALIVRRRAAARIELYEGVIADLGSQREGLLDAIERLNKTLDRLRNDTIGDKHS